MRSRQTPLTQSHRTLRRRNALADEPQLDELLADVEELQRQAKARGGGATHGAM
ncbi:MAG: hypothetical protein IT182_02645 [Acidobacteria bacterium]|nr:hypothetical protein [Acidobacteriota bacterium]